MRFFYIFIAAFLVFSAGFVAFVQNFSHIPYSNNYKADAIIVLTGGHARLLSGIKLLENKKGQRMLLSGVNKHISNKAIIRALGIKDHNLMQHIDIGRYALNTAGNAIETALWVKKYNYKTIYVVTNDYHMPRSLLELKMALPNIVLLPAPIKDYEIPSQLWQHLTFNQTINLLAEFSKYIRTNIKYYLTKLISS